jgi:predicted ester cyclase
MQTVRRLFCSVTPLCALLTLACEPPAPDFREANKQVIRDLYAALDAQDFDRLRAMTSSDTQLRLVGTQDSVAWNEVEDMIRMYYGAFEGYCHVIDQLVAEGDWVVARVTFSGTHTGEFQGIPATGNTFTYGGVHVMRVVDGVLQENWLLEDDLRLMQQLGMVLAPSESGS